MQIVIKNTLVIAAHVDSQNIIGVPDYAGCLVLAVPDGTPVEIGQTWEVGLDEAIASMVAEAAAACDAVLAPLASRFSSRETLTWPAQLSEARALLANPTLAIVPDPASEEAATWVDPIPTLRGITSVTGEDLGEFAGAVIKNNDDWTRITTYCVGLRQKIVARIKECGTPEEVAAVDISITLPTGG